MFGSSPPVVPVQFPGAIGNTYHPTGGPLTREELDWCRNRPEGVPRPPLPAPGDVVGYRAKPSGPVVAARVHEVESLTDPWAHEHDAFEPHGPDVNVWRVVTNEAGAAQYDLTRPGSYRFEPTDDPWPSVVLCIEPERIEHEDGTTGQRGARTYVVTKEARLPGSAGWTTPDQIGR
jgi:hypothetical protein